MLAGFVAQLGNGFFESLFIQHAPQPLPAIENVLVGPLIAVLSFVCSVGNVPLAAVLWSGGISFSGVLAFLYADLIVLPILLIYRKYYGMKFTVRITALMLLTMAIAALAVGGLFSLLGAIPSGPRPTRADIFGQITVNYKLFLNALGIVVFVALFWITVTAWRHRPRLRDDRGSEQGAHHGRGRQDSVLLLGGVPAELRGRWRRGRAPHARPRPLTPEVVRPAMPSRKPSR